MSLARNSETGPRANVPRRLRIHDESILRSRALAYYRQRLDGLTDSEIGRYWGRSRQYINTWINALSTEQKIEVRKDRLRSIRADHLLQDAESDPEEIAHAR